MPKVLQHGHPIDSAYTLETIDGVSGLVLESWGPKDRNPEYAQAVEHLLARLIENQITTIKVYVVSADLIKAYPNIEDRVIEIDGSSEIYLQSILPNQLTDLRLKIGRKVGDLKVNPKSKGGNRYKRILIHHPSLTETDWRVLAETDDALALYRPSIQSDELEQKIAVLQRRRLEIPAGELKPKQTMVSTVAYYRDPQVKAWILQHAQGTCEACGNPAPFLKADGQPYLEVHHLHPLSEGGSDTVENTIAVCPNCHRQLHVGSDRTVLVQHLKLKIKRLKSSL